MGFVVAPSDCGKGLMMAIGADGEIGVVFAVWRDMSNRDRDVWCLSFRERFGADLMKGYARVCYPKGRQVRCA